MSIIFQEILEKKNLSKYSLNISNVGTEMKGQKINITYLLCTCTWHSFNLLINPLNNNNPYREAVHVVRTLLRLELRLQHDQLL